MMVEDIVASVDIDANRERVWTALTSPELVAEWLGCLEFEPRLGHLFYMQQDPAKRANGDISGATHCEIEALDEPEHLAFTWFIPGTPKTRVAIDVTETAGGTTRVELRHHGWDQFEADQIRGLRDMLAGGWTSHVLPGLKRVAEDRTDPIAR